MENLPEEKNSRLKSWIKKVGAAGLIFFTVKGLVWLAVIYFGVDFLKACNP